MEALPSLFFRSSSQRRRVYELLRIRELESLREGGRESEGRVGDDVKLAKFTFTFVFIIVTSIQLESLDLFYNRQLLKKAQSIRWDSAQCSARPTQL